MLAKIKANTKHVGNIKQTASISFSFSDFYRFTNVDIVFGWMRI